MKKLVSAILCSLMFMSFNSYAEETLTIEKQLVGIVGAISGTVKTETRELKEGDKIYLMKQFMLLKAQEHKFYF